MKIKCEIIKDLLPLYCDKLTSQVSNEAIEEHISDCTECKGVYESMRSESKADIPDTDIEPLKKVRKKNKLKIVAGFVSGAVLLGVLFAFMYVGVVPASSEDVSVSYSGRVLEDGGMTIEFELTTDSRYYLGARGRRNCIVTDDGGIDYADGTDTFYRVFKLPFSDMGVPGSSTVDFVRADGEYFDGNDIYTINFRDGEVTYDLKAIAEELGLQ